MVLQKQAQQRLLSDIRILLFSHSLSGVCNVLFAFRTNTECQGSCCCLQGTPHSQSRSLSKGNSLAYRRAFSFLICITCTSNSFHLLYWSLSTTNLSSNSLHSALNSTILNKYFHTFANFLFLHFFPFPVHLGLCWTAAGTPAEIPFSTSSSPSTHRKLTT